MLRPAFTLVEILVVIVIMGIVSALTINSGLATQKQAIFQTNFQTIVLMVQEVRSLALADSNEINNGYGIQMELDTQTVTSFVDLDNDGFYTATDRELDTINLLDNPNFNLAATAYALQEGAKDFVSTLVPVNTNTITIFFPTKALACNLVARVDGLNEELSYIEANFTDNATRNRILSLHHLSCIPEVSQKSLL
ncbi:hypothetical protein COW94_02025 [Candidatus Peregrinibacteria bacterium CG22_combo_CG10-13_8_21_14_all_44_10]|nr:MAG: hypothetical protein COW94_02025 [Candidatus Peregrinibacteria bacterium CG22_combo_CG10-13_8_21_14_all_44_10]PIQ80016.1 MAG: hypothetical protein COV81_00080 [Candidatus Peregrinibacteria bacterium CG11_big_fil_rev_8_21_14_0_20_41_10]PIZ74417.1 MAG: hypothetical protein COY06_04245 [Candidatus Peregrinibacteria bacterium CG_4_10_14_0_2_um_filter_41_8]